MDKSLRIEIWQKTGVYLSGITFCDRQAKLKNALR
jgi:hypothetical protein